MSKTFDLSTLNLSAGTHEITVKARASGYLDSPASDPVSYVVADEETYTVSGTWHFDEHPSIRDFIIAVGAGSIVKFVSNGETYEAIGRYGDNMLSYILDQSPVIVYISGTGWENEAYRTITFDGIQSVSKEFYEWLEANAERQTITFTIGDTQYFADVGMTWGQWVASEFNTGVNYGGHIYIPTVKGDCIFVIGSSYITNTDVGGKDIDEVNINDVIVANKQYYINDRAK
jgi:hypothetical protein